MHIHMYIYRYIIKVQLSRQLICLEKYTPKTKSNSIRITRPISHTTCYINISLNLNTNTSISFSGDFGFADLLVVSVKMSTDWETKEMPCDKNTTCKYLIFYEQLHIFFWWNTWFLSDRSNSFQPLCFVYIFQCKADSNYTINLKYLKSFLL